jgi:hypothetical protein
MWPPPWDSSLGFPETTQEWFFPPLLASMGYNDGDVLDMLTYPRPEDMDNPFGEPYIEWPLGEMEVENPEEPGTWIMLSYQAEVQWVDYMGPDGIVYPATPTVHISITTPDGNGVEGTPLAGTTVPVSIWIPNNPDENLMKKIFWQMTSDKSPTPTGSPPTTMPPGTSQPAPNPQIQHDASQWYTYNGLNEIVPNPDGEWLTFELVDSTNIEEIVIKTVCMPEPATLSLMAMGGLGVLLGRRRRR